jgi:hypothetical protein
MLRDMAGREECGVDVFMVKFVVGVEGESIGVD